MNDKVTQLYTRDEIEDDLVVVDYVAGRLSDEDREAFEARLKDDDELLARVIEERGFRSAVVEAVDGEEPDAAAIDKLRKDLGDEPVKRASPWRKAAIAAVLVAAASVVVFMERPGGPPPESFETLSSDEVVPVIESNRVRLVFADGVTEADRLELGHELGFEVVSGPGAGGAWLVASDSVVNRDELDNWRSDSRIVLAEPVRYRQAP